MSLETYILLAPTMLLATARTLGIMLTAPVFSAAVVPVRVRVALAVVIGLAVCAKLTGEPVIPGSAIDLAGLCVMELAVGATIGYVASLVLAGVELGAFHVAQQLGVGLAEVFDPSGGEEGGPVRRLFQMLALVTFLAIGGHRAVIGAVTGSFRAMPVAEFWNGLAPASALHMVVVLLGSAFALALKAAGPVLAAVLLANLVLGMLQRTLPQLHTMSVGLPMQALVGLFVLSAGLWVVAELVDRFWQWSVPQIGTWLGG